MQPVSRRVVLAIALLTATVLLAATQACGPSLQPYQAMRFPADPPETASSGVQVTFLGVSTLLIQDGETAFMTDGFFTRPGVLSLLLASRLRPDSVAIDSALSRLGVEPGGGRLAAVIPLHSHYDHVMDAPVVAERTGARLVGSPSTRAVAESMGYGGSFTAVRAGGTVPLGRFGVEFIECVHGPPDRWPGVVRAPFRTPAPAGHYRTGNCFSLLVEREGRSFLVTGTAGFVPGAYAGRDADVVYLSVGGLGKADSLYRASYWDEVVRATRARRVVLIHWDNLTRSVHKPLRSIPRLEDDLTKTIGQYCTLAAHDGVDLRLAREWTAADPFAGLPADGARLRGGCPGR